MVSQLPFRGRVSRNGFMFRGPINSRGSAIKHNDRPLEKGLARNSHHKATRHTN